jgi:hypothetical protein
MCATPRANSCDCNFPDPNTKNLNWPNRFKLREVFQKKSVYRYTVFAPVGRCNREPKKGSTVIRLLQLRFRRGLHVPAGMPFPLQENTFSSCLRLRGKYPLPLRSKISFSGVVSRQRSGKLLDSNMLSGYRACDFGKPIQNGQLAS